MLKRNNLICLFTVVLLCFIGDLFSQGYCRVSVEGLNKNRYLFDEPIYAECPPCWPHSCPFGNWGAASNFGDKEDGHQFQGWCHYHWACDNYDYCTTHCQDPWWQWNSCTRDTAWLPPNTDFYNAANGWEQETIGGINEIGGIYINYSVDCPYDTDGDGTCDRGGCLDVYSAATSNNFMSLYELDPWRPDTLVQSVYVGYDPPTSLYVNANCDIYGCWPTTGQWLSVDYWEDPDYQIVDAQMAIKITGAAYIDTVDCEYLRFSNPQYQCDGF